MNKLSLKINLDPEDSFQSDASVMETNVTAIEVNIDSSMLDVFPKAQKKVEMN